MTPPAPERLAPTAAADAIVWGLEHVAHLINHELDPAKTRHEARASLRALPRFGPGELLESFRLASTSMRMRCAPVALSAADIFARTVPFPLVAIVEGRSAPHWLLLTERQGARVHVQTEPEIATWMTEAELAAELGGSAPVTWLHVVPSTPMESVSSASHAVEDVIGGEDGKDQYLRHLRPWERVSALLKLERDDVWVVVIYSAAVGLLSLATPVAVQSLVGTVAFGTLLQPIVILALLFLVALGFQGVLKALQARVIEALQARLFARVALDVAYRLPRARKDDHHPVTPELVNRFFDVMTVQKAFASVLTDGLSAFMQIVIGLLVLGFYHPYLLALDIIILIATTLLVLLPVRRGVRTAFDESRYKYEVGAWLEELSRAPAAFRGSGGAALANARADALTREYLAARKRHFAVIYGQTISALAVQVVASAVLLGFGGFLVVNESLTLGQLIAAELIVAAVTSSITKFGKILESTYDLVTGLSKIGHLIDLEVDSSESGETLPGGGPVGLKLKDVAFDGLQLSFEVKPGARTAIVGAQGSGLGEILSAVKKAEHGTYEVQGVDVRRAQACALHDDVMLVRADDLFMGTVYENVSLTRPGVTPSEVRSAVERVGLDDDVRALEKGYDTELGPLGSPLTPSQAVRLVVARALAASPRLIVVDDTLDALDPVSRSRTVAALTKKDAPWTLIALVSDPGCALARACGEVRDVSSLSAPSTPPAAEATP
ncbi:MAG: ATP-binding cassette domain-containing protein [Myxococcaceae bacterium]|nr:ATP-binding cassette domain-containing protein [Myxococcaceae bacterium]MCA3014121.1 ATP-binding cassette domain-containing protein [Myxococcaceae bacterium]